MAVQQGYGASIYDGLIFAYDIGDIVNSYKGEPSTNLVVDPDGNANVLSTDVPFGTNVIGYAQYSSGYYVNPRGTTPTSASGRTFTYSVWMRSRSATPSTYLMYVYTGTGPDGGWYYFGDGPLTQNWQRYTYTRGDMGGTISTVTVYRYNQAGTIEIAAPQIEENSHATQFLKGSRSATTSILDLTGKNSINNLASFSSNAGLIFDGTDDRLVVTPNQSFSLGDYAMEVVFSADALPGKRHYLIDPRGNGGESNSPMYLLFDDNGSQIRIVGGNSNIEVDSGYRSIEIGRYYHLICTRIGSTCKLYLNGVEVGSGNTGSSSLTISTPYRIGTYAAASSGQYFLNGKIAVAKIYSTGMTVSQVSQNYKKYQTRFGIA